MSSSSAVFSSPALLFGTAPFAERFKADILDYCEKQGYHLTLSAAEIELLSWQVGNTYQTPEAGKNADGTFKHIPFEVKRSLARAYAFDLLQRGDEAAYQQFIQGQEANVKLSLTRFQALSQEAKQLDVDGQAASRATAFLVPSLQLRKVLEDHLTDELRALLKQRQLSDILSKDSEEFLSQFAVIIAVKPELTPLTRNMTSAQMALLEKAFWPGLHMRWLYSTEGGDNMTQTLVDGIRANTFNQTPDLSVWTWRWRLNIAGFQGGPGAKMYDSVSDTLCENLLIELNALFKEPERQFLPHYLTRLAHTAGIPDQQEEKSSLTNEEVAFLGHLIAYLAYFHRIDIFTPANANALVAAYLSFKAEFPADQGVADCYLQACRNPKAVTPTYVPGVMDTVLGLCKFHVDSKALDTAATLPNEMDSAALFKVHPENAAEALKRSVQFMCQLLSAIYKTGLEQRISCMTLAKADQVKSVLTAWLADHQAVSFSFSSDMQAKAEVINCSGLDNRFRI